MHLIKKILSRYTLFLLFSLSALVRIFVFVLFKAYELYPVFDELAYWEKAQLFAYAIKQIIFLNLPTREVISAIYGNGIRPPLQSLIIAIPIVILGPNVGMARLLILVISALTTPIIYLLSKSLTQNKKISLVSALMYLFHPALIGFSHYLWTETVYIAFFALLSLTAFKLTQAKRQQGKYAAFMGIFLSLAFLTRAVGIMNYLVVVPWLFFTLKSNKIKLIAITLIFSFLILIPWKIALLYSEGYWAPLYTSGSYNLYRYNNPWLTDNLSRYERRLITLKVNQTIKKYADEYNFNTYQATKILAKESITNNWSGFISRSINKLPNLWPVYSTITRHIFSIIYPPLSVPLFLLALSALVVFDNIFIILIIWGLATELFKSKTTIIVLLAMVNIGPAIITVTNGRYVLPSLVLLIPFAAIGLRCLIQITEYRFFQRWIVLFFLFTISLSLILHSFNSFFKKSFSSYYYSEIFWISKIFDVKNVKYSDNLIFYTPNVSNVQSIILKINSPNYFFDSQKNQQIQFSLTPRNSFRSIKIVSSRPVNELSVIIQNQKINQVQIIKPIKKDNWRKWRFTEINNLYYMWTSDARTVLNPQTNLFQRVYAIPSTP